MYLVPLMSALVEAGRAHFNPDYDEPDFANLWVSVEYPKDKENYPGVWINYDDSEPLIRAGIDQREVVLDDIGGLHEVTRWRFQGEVSLTCAALTSLERDRLFDEVVGMIAYASVNADTGGSVFHDHIDTNDFIAFNGNFDEITVAPGAISPGTPWGTDELIYEKTITFAIQGEFVSDPEDNNALIALSSVQYMGFRQGTPAPAFPDDPNPAPNAPAWNPTHWT